MAEMIIGKAPYFDRGIDRIVDTPDAPVLPDSGLLKPLGSPQVFALEELLFAENLEWLLDVYVRPMIVERDLLSPLRFRRAMQVVLARFKRTAQALRDSNPRVARLLESAAGVLDEEIELRELLEMYQLALLRG